MTLTRPRDLLAVGLVVAVLANLVVRLLYASLPTFPLLAGVTLGVLGVAEAIAGGAIRKRIRREEGTEPLQPLVAVRVLLLAKASSLGGTIVAGLWTGLLVYVLPNAFAVDSAASDARAAGVGLGCALVLVGGALWLERCCRTPDDPDEPSVGGRP